MHLFRPGGIIFVGVAQPYTRDGDERRLDYRGSLLTPTEKMHVARLISSGQQPMPLVIDHANLSGYGETVPEHLRIGYATDALVDPEFGLIAVGCIEPERPEARIIANSIRMGKKWGLSFYTDFQYHVETLDVVRLGVSHLGVTDDPAWAEFNSYIYEWSHDPMPIRRILRTFYLSRPGIYVPPETLERLAITAEADYADYQQRKLQYGYVTATAGKGNDWVKRILKDDCHVTQLRQLGRRLAVPRREQQLECAAVVATRTRETLIPSTVMAEPVAEAPIQPPVVQEQPPAAAAAAAAPPPAADAMVLEAAEAKAPEVEAASEAMDLDAPDGATAAGANLTTLLTGSALAEKVLKDVMELENVESLAIRLEQANALQRKIEQLQREGRFDLKDLLKADAPVPKALKMLEDYTELLIKRPLDYLEAQHKNKLLDSVSYDIARGAFSTDEPSLSSRVICAHVQAAAIADMKSQKEFEAIHKATRAAQAESSALKRKLDEMEAANATMREQFDLIAKRLRMAEPDLLGDTKPVSTGAATATPVQTQSAAASSQVPGALTAGHSLLSTPLPSGSSPQTALQTAAVGATAGARDSTLHGKFSNPGEFHRLLKLGKEMTQTTDPSVFGQSHVLNSGVDERAYTKFYNYSTI